MAIQVSGEIVTLSDCGVRYEQTRDRKGKDFLMITNRFLSIAAAGLLSFSAQAASAKDVVGVAVGNPKLKTLVAAVKAADLVDTLKGKGPFTVFAPTDAAFSRLPKGTLQSLLKPENKSKLASILIYHVVPAKIRAADVAGKRTTVKTVQGGKLHVDGRHGVTINTARVTTADVKASNGVIHVINRVLLPKD